MKVSLIGSGYVGVVTGACLAEKGHDVYCVDVDKDRVEKINRGHAPVYEDGLDELLRRHVGTRLFAIQDLRRSVLDSDITLITVGTPFDGNEIDLRFVKEAAGEIGSTLADKNNYHVVAVKSTVVPGTTESCVLPILEAKSGKKAGVDFGVGTNPEFLREGTAVKDFMDPDRIVLGGIDDRTINCLASLYEVFHDVDFVRTSVKTAEMIKYTSNSLLATLISFSNEIGNLCAALGGVDVADVMNGVHLDRRLSPITSDRGRLMPAITSYLEAGCGFGGSCFPKDVQALIAHGRAAKQPMELLQAVMRVNRQQPHQMLEMVGKHFRDVTDVRFAVLGLAFKPGTDDMRESPAIPVVTSLLERGALIQAYDPAAQDAAQRIFGNGRIQYCGSLEQAIDNVEAILLLTRWDEFHRLPGLLEHLESQPFLFDGRRMLPRNSVQRYEGIGVEGERYDSSSGGTHIGPAEVLISSNYSANEVHV